jgi:hypothetical protein
MDSYPLSTVHPWLEKVSRAYTFLNFLAVLGIEIVRSILSERCRYRCNVHLSRVLAPWLDFKLGSGVPS